MQFNFVGKLLGPQGNSLKRLQAETGTKMSILGKGCMRDKTKEEELRRGGEGKYFHLREELHVLIEVFAPPGEAYARMGHALKEVKKFLVPDYNDEIRQEQLRELTFLNGSSEHTHHGLGRGRAGGRPIHNLPPPHAAPAVGRVRGGTFIGPAGLLRHLPLKTRCMPLPRMVLGAHVPSISGPRAPPQHHVPPPTPNSFSDYLYCDGYPGAVEQLSYDVMNNSYCAVPQSAASIYDFELEDSEATTFEPFIQWEAHNTSYIEPWPAPPRQLKAPASRGSKGSFRDHPYGQF
uniref:KH domain containing, RNA binding, signal transduction associated 2 n=1 Tax=Eptatretus burgeri TaxID=7764 RepID=A0A8C4QSM4_EPTBU